MGMRASTIFIICVGAVLAVVEAMVPRTCVDGSCAKDVVVMDGIVYDPSYIVREEGSGDQK